MTTDAPAAPDAPPGPDAADPIESPAGLHPPRGDKPTVLVIGGGIAGLTAAHELASRGFLVTVMEARTREKPSGRREMLLGGMASSQYDSVPGLMEPMGEDSDVGPYPGQSVTSDHSPNLFTPVWFKPGTTEFTDAGRRNLEWVREQAACAYSDYLFQATGYADPATEGRGQLKDGLTPEQLSKERSRAVIEFIREHPGNEHHPIRPVGRGLADPRVSPFADDTSWNCRVEVRSIQADLAGEHGFRFFPGYYRHMQDTMSRIPRPQGGSVLDNLVSTPITAVAGQGGAPLVTQLIPGSGLEATMMMEAMLRQGLTLRDLHQFVLRVLRFLSTCRHRRQDDFQDLSWWQYLAAWTPETGDRYRYSEAFENMVVNEPRVLAAFNGQFGDAFSDGITMVQLMMPAPPGVPRSGTLNGPTTEALIQPWKQRLVDLGVRFERGTLQRFSLAPGSTGSAPRLRVHVMKSERSNRDARRQVVDEGRAAVAVLERDGHAAEAHAERQTFLSVIETGFQEIEDEVGEKYTYVVCATDAATAERATEGLKLPGEGYIGAIEGLRGYTTIVNPPPPGTVPGEPGEQPPEATRCETNPGRTGWDRFQTMTGIQYFFQTDVSFVAGHLYYTDAAWALSSINEQQFWAHKPSLLKDGWVSVLSVDIGDFQAPSDNPALNGRCAWQCTRDEIAREVWRQILASLALHKDKFGIDQGFAFHAPTWYHLDTGILFGDEKPPPGIPAPPPEERDPVHVANNWCTVNLTPYLVPVAGDWERRPGALPWNPSSPKSDRLPLDLLPRGLWQPNHGGYYLHYEKLVFAGIYKKNFTRMTTMESANETGRHAANTVLAHANSAMLLAGHPPDREAQRPGPAGAVPFPPAAQRADPAQTPADHNAGGDFRNLPGPRGALFQPTLMGDYARIWDPNNFEPSLFQPLKELDYQLWRKGMPGLFDLFGIELKAMLETHLPDVAWAPPTNATVAEKVADLLALAFPFSRTHGDPFGVPDAKKHVPSKEQVEASLKDAWGRYTATLQDLFKIDASSLGGLHLGGLHRTSPDPPPRRSTRRGRASNRRPVAPGARDLMADLKGVLEGLTSLREDLERSSEPDR